MPERDYNAQSQSYNIQIVTLKSLTFISLSYTSPSLPLVLLLLLLLLLLFHKSSKLNYFRATCEWNGERLLIFFLPPNAMVSMMSGRRTFERGRLYEEGVSFNCLCFTWQGQWLMQSALKAAVVQCPRWHDRTTSYLKCLFVIVCPY